MWSSIAQQCFRTRLLPGAGPIAPRFGGEDDLRRRLRFSQCPTISSCPPRLPWDTCRRESKNVTRLEDGVSWSGGDCPRGLNDRNVAVQYQSRNLSVRWPRNFVYCTVCSASGLSRRVWNNRAVWSVFLPRRFHRQLWRCITPPPAATRGLAPPEFAASRVRQPPLRLPVAGSTRELSSRLLRWRDLSSEFVSGASSWVALNEFCRVARALGSSDNDWA